MNETHEVDASGLLKSDLARGEWQGLEFKETFPDRADDLAENIASFATSNPGRIYIGISDDGEVVGVGGIANLQDTKAKDSCQLRIQGITRKIDPPVIVEVDFVKADSKVVVRIYVPNGAEPVYYVNERPYLRDLNVSRPAKPAEVKELHSRHFRSLYPTPATLTKTTGEEYEIETYVDALLNATGSTELTLMTYKDSLMNPDLVQMLYDIHVYAEIFHGMSLVKPAEQLELQDKLVSMSEQLDGLAAHRFVGTESVIEFGRIAKRSLSSLDELKRMLNSRVKAKPIDTYSKSVKQELASLQNDWRSRERRFKIGNEELLKEAIRQHAFIIYRLSFRPEAVELQVRADLTELGLKLHELSSTENYFGYWWGDERLKRIEQKFSECEPLISDIMRKIS